MSLASRATDQLWVCHLGSVPYRDALAMQEHLRARRQAGELPDTLLLLEHPPVYTRGRRSHDGELTLGEDFYRAQGIEIVPTKRGGRVTYHGPGQLVGYPIMGVEDVLAHLRTIERALVAALAQEGIDARSRVDDGPDFTGVWVGPRKIASLGVHVSRGVSTHGFAVNVATDLDPFSWVIACGLPDVQMTSVARELAPGAAPGLTCFRRRVAHQFCEAHGRRQRLVSPRRLGIDAPVAGAPLAEAPTAEAPNAGSPTAAAPVASSPARWRGRTPRAHRPGAQPARADATRHDPLPHPATNRTGTPAGVPA